jgi:hypothetical protein
MKHTPLLMQLIRLLALRSEFFVETFDGCWRERVALTANGLDLNSVLNSLAAKPGEMNLAKGRTTFGATGHRVVKVHEVDHTSSSVQSEKDRSLGWRQAPFDHQVEFVHAALSKRERIGVALRERLFAIRRAFMRRWSQ